MAYAQLIPKTFEVSDTAASLPIIDISGLRSARLSDRTKVGQQIGETRPSRHLPRLVKKVVALIPIGAD